MDERKGWEGKVGREEEETRKSVSLGSEDRRKCKTE